MKKNKPYLAIEDCITLNDARIITKEKKNVKKVKTKNRLAKLLDSKMENSKYSEILPKLYRYESEGVFLNENTAELIEAILKTLDVTVDELIKKA